MWENSGRFACATQNVGMPQNWEAVGGAEKCCKRSAISNRRRKRIIGVDRQIMVAHGRLASVARLQSR